MTLKHEGQFKKGHTPWNKGLKGVRFGGHNGLSMEANPRWRKGHMLMTNGYRYITVAPNKRMYEHRWVMEQHLGRKLGTNEHVHHINHDKTDNRIENLELLDNVSHGRESANKRWSVNYGL